jgi:hypothetical protein
MSAEAPTSVAAGAETQDTINTATDAPVGEQNTINTATDAPVDEQASGDGDLDAEAALEEALVQDIKDGAITGTVLTQEVFAPWKAIFAVNDTQYCKDFIGNNNVVKATLVFRCPDQQRSSVALRVMIPRHLTRDNPKKIATHSIWITFPVPAISGIQYTKLQPNTTLSRDTHGLEAGEGFVTAANELRQLAQLRIQSRQVLISGGAIPPLATPELDTQFQQFMSVLRTPDTAFNIILRHSPEFTCEAYALFHQRMIAEIMQDPAMAWIRDSPSAAALTMGNIVPINDRPNIPSQRAETCFWDKMAHLIPTIYGAVFEDEFQELLNNELGAEQFTMTLVEAPNARNVLDDATDGNPPAQ